MSVQIEVNGRVYELDGSELLTRQEFQVLGGYVSQYRSEVSKLSEKKEHFRALERKVLSASPSAELSEGDLDDLATLAEIRADECLAQADLIIAKIDEIWSIAPELVTGGGYELHLARAEAAN